MNVVAGSAGNGVYYSNDFGATWNVSESSSQLSWNALCSDSSGQSVFAGTNGFIWQSVDFGASWTQLNTIDTTWISITCDDEGVNLAAVGLNCIYISRDSGASWTQSDSSIAWTSVSSNSTGQLVLATAGLEGIYKSENFGLSWTQSLSPAGVTSAWSVVRVGSTGENIGLISSDLSNVYISSNSGSSWISSTAAEQIWYALSTNSQGSMMVSAVYGGGIFVGNGNDSLVIVAPQPSASPIAAVKTNSKSVSSTIYTQSSAGLVLIIAPAVVVLVGRLSLVFARQSIETASINKINGIMIEGLESTFRAVNILFTFNALIITNGSKETTALLLLSRIIIALVWLVFFCGFLLPIRNNSRLPFANLSLYLNSNAMKQRVPISAFDAELGAVSMRFVVLCGMLAGAFDITVLRLLPWTSSEFTSIVQGYPNMTTVRCCLYGTLISTLLQSLASIVSVSHSTDAETLLYLFISLFNLMLSLLSVVLLLQIANTSSLQVSIVFRNKADARKSDVEMGAGRNTLVMVEEEVSSPLAPVTPATASDVVEGDSSISPIVMTAPPESIITPIEDTERDERGILFASKMEYADQTMEILKEQLSKKGENPVEYIPLPKLRAELDGMFASANSGTPYDEARLDYLLTLDYNPEYKREKAAEDKQWREAIREFSTVCLQTMKSFVPPNIFYSSVESLKSGDCGYSQDLAKRLFTKNCLWLVRIAAADIERMHIAELQGRFNPQAQGLDIVELAAIYAAIPETFGKDHKKEAWRLSLEKQLKDLEKDRQAGKLVGAKKRHPAYKNQTAVFGDVSDLHTMKTVVSEDVYKPRDSFKQLKSTRNVAGQGDDRDDVAADAASAAAAASAPVITPGSVTSKDTYESLAEKLNKTLLSRNNRENDVEQT